MILHFYMKNNPIKFTSKNLNLKSLSSNQENKSQKWLKI